jgi:hypothetical protein
VAAGLEPPGRVSVFVPPWDIVGSPLGKRGTAVGDGPGGGGFLEQPADMSIPAVKSIPLSVKLFMRSSS